MNRQEFDQFMKTTIKEDVSQVSVPDYVEQRIHADIYRQTQMGGICMKKYRTRKIFLAAVLATMFVGSVVYAGSGRAMLITGSTRSGKDYKEFSKLKVAEKKCGLEDRNITAIEHFKNGYTFDGINIDNVKEVGEDGEIQRAYKTIQISYKKDNSKVELCIDPVIRKYEVREQDKIIEKDGISYQCSEWENKYVPEDYTLSEEEKQKVEEKLLNIGYMEAGAKIEEVTSKHVSWVRDGIFYQLLNMDGASMESLLSMAQELNEK